MSAYTDIMGSPAQPNGPYRRLLSATHGHQPRYCSQCRCQRPRAGGREITYNGGRNARWVCALHQQESA